MSILVCTSLSARKKKSQERVKMKKGIKPEVGATLFKVWKDKSGRKGVFEGICQKAVISAVIWVKVLIKVTEEEPQREV